ncbi:MAG: N-acetylmuramic acid 6-phosphate etherase [Mesorhizobium sp.]|nr:MAG: N-acetylmuramic acid 6-phosphate etherase [Mesorhizobium sp.]
MAEKRTEAHHQNAEGLDIQAPDAILSFLADAQIEAAKAVRGAIPAIAAAAEIVAERLKDGGRLAYAAAGSSGLIAISASGSTPYAVAALEDARSRGAATIAIANNRDVPLFRLADVAIVLETPPELIAGSTRMGAGTAQKIALNMLSTLAAIHLGHVHDGYMVNLTADNIKLRDRAARIVAAIGGCGRDDAARLLEKSGGVVKTAILLAAGAANADAAEKILEGTGRKLRPALSAIEGSKGR